MASFAENRHDTAGARHEFGSPDLDFGGAMCEQDRPTATEIDRLFAALEGVSWATHPRTARLLAAGRSKLARKIRHRR
jgi:hypothetical protein